MTAEKAVKRMVNFNLDADLIDPIEEARFKNKLPNRTAAINFLIRRGLACPPPDGG